MNTFEDYLDKIDNEVDRDKLRNILYFVENNFPKLTKRLAWNQPMFTMEGTFIIGFSAAKRHFSVAPEESTMERFRDRIDRAGYSQTKGLYRVGWDQLMDYNLLEDIIAFNIEDKRGYTKFWR